MAEVSANNLDQLSGPQPPSDSGTVVVEPLAGPLSGIYFPPGDRCITQRALILGAIARGPMRLMGALESPQTVATRRVLAQLGVSFTIDAEDWLVVARRDGAALQEPLVDLDCGDSLETLWLMAGMLCGQDLAATLTGSSQLLAGDCGPLVDQLALMDARLECLGSGQRPPLGVQGRQLKVTELTIPPHSYLLKDSLVMASLSVQGISRLIGAVNGNDHLERLLRQMGVSIRRSGDNLTVKGGQNVHPRRIMIPGDVTAAAPLVVAAALTPGSDVLLRQVGANPGRMGLFKTLGRVGADLNRERDWQYGSEPVANLRVRYSPELESFSVSPNLAPFLIEEFPLLALVATQVKGRSHLRNGIPKTGATPNIQQMTSDILRQFGADIEQTDDGYIVTGPTPLTGAEVQCAGNLSLGMLALAAALIAKGPSTLHAAGALEDSYPGLLREIQQLAKDEDPGQG